MTDEERFLLIERLRRKIADTERDIKRVQFAAGSLVPRRQLSKLLGEMESLEIQLREAESPQPLFYSL